VRTTVWFVEVSGKCYVRTHSDSGKAKRMRANPKVRVSPSSFSGRAKGEWVEARASPASADEATAASRLFNRRYNVQKWMTDLLAWLGRKRYICFCLEFE
jgi:uncharacterized protein